MIAQIAGYKESINKVLGQNPTLRDVLEYLSPDIKMMNLCRCYSDKIAVINLLVFLDIAPRRNGLSSRMKVEKDIETWFRSIGQ